MVINNFNHLIVLYVQYKSANKETIFFHLINTASFTSWWLQHIVHCGWIITVSSVLAADGVH